MTDASPEERDQEIEDIVNMIESGKLFVVSTTEFSSFLRDAKIISEPGSSVIHDRVKHAANNFLSQIKQVKDICDGDDNE